MAKRTKSMVACSPNISVPISTERMPPSRYSSTANHTAELRNGNVRQKGARVDINRVAARRLHDGHAFRRDVIAKKCRGSDALFQVILFKRFAQADGDRIQVASGQAAVCWKAFRENQKVFFLPGEEIVVSTKKATDIHEPIFFSGRGAAIGVRKHFARNLEWRFVREAHFAQFDEVGVLREAASIDTERDAVL
jgi:hypothetical protein